jgi:TonB-dependent receptor
VKYYDVARQSLLLGGVSALALSAFALSAPLAYAQDTTTTAASSDDETIVVTGIRQSLQSAQQIKRNADQIVDSVTAVDIGALPDRSVSEALQRIPGIQLQRTNENRDPARLASEGGGVFIRGLSWVRSETNGRDIFSASNGRVLSFEDVSADLLAGVDVYKNPSAELIEGGIGGIVNLRTRKPFDQAGQLVAGSLDYNYADLLKDGFWSGSALYSNRWQTGIGEFGALFDLSIGNVGNRTDSLQVGRFEPRTLGAAQDGFAAGDTVYVPNSYGWRRIDWKQERTAFATALQWAPTEQFTLTFQGLYAQATPKDIEHALGDTDGGFPTDDTSYTFADNGALTSGTFTDAHITADTRYGERHNSTGDYSIGFTWFPAEDWSFSGDYQYIESKAKVLSMTVFTQLGTQAPNTSADRPEFSFNLTGDSPTWSLSNPMLQAQQDQYWWAAAMDHIEDNDAQSQAARFDIEHTFSDDGFLKSFRFGARATDRHAVTRQTGYNWSLLSNQFWGGGGGPPVYIDQTGFPDNVNDNGTPGDTSDDFIFPVGQTNAGLPDQAELFTYDNFFRGNIQLPGVGWFPTEGLTHNTQNAYSYLQATESSGWGWVPLTNGSYTTASPAGDNISGGINRQTENTTAFYGVLRFGSDQPMVFGVPMDGNIGVRYVRTENTAAGRLNVSGVPDACAITPSPDCTAAAAFAAAAATTRDYKNSYENVLPSLNLRFHLSDDVQLRLAAAKAMIRPNFSQMTPFANLSFDFQGTSFNPTNPQPFTGTAGDPYLKPTTSDQFDASLEWYFAPTGSVSAAAFYKKIHDYIIVDPTSHQTYTAGGQTYDFVVAQQRNGEEGKVQGFELAYTQFFDMLPGWMSGFGVQANYTYIDNSGGANTAVNLFEDPQVAGAANSTLPLEGMSRTSYNITGMYEKYGLSARLAYNWRERYLLTTSAANIQRPVWSEDYGQLDGSVFYSINTHVKVGLQGTNLLNTRTFLDVGDTTLAPRYSWTDTDRRVAFAVRANF